jgi:histidinol-phosphatase
MDEYPSPETLISYLKQAEDFARAGAAVSSRYFGTSIEVERKADSSPVTIADRESEQEMRQLILSAFPDHQILGEEFGSAGDGESPWKWVLDPIDGTKSFIHGIPLYTVLVALMYEDQAMLGVIYNPQTDELVSAGIGMGCWYNGQATRVSTVSSLEEARLQLTDPGDYLRRDPKHAADIMSGVRLTRTWADAHGYLLIATGRAEIMIDPEMSLWDIACLQPIITEAGGEFTDIRGNRALGSSAVATNGLLHEEVMRTIGVSEYHRH